MNANNVFIGVTFNNEELLLYLESPDKMINLITGEYVNSSNIKINCLVPYTSLKSAKHQLKHMIVRRYEKDRSQKLEVSNIFIGDILQTKDFKFVREYNSDLPMMYRGLEYSITSYVIKKKALLYRIKKGMRLTSLSNVDLYESTFIDLDTGIKYSDKNYDDIGSLFIDAKMIPYLSEVKYDGPREEKRMVLKKYRERRGK